MIEFVCYRVKKILRKYLPDLIDTMVNYWKTIDESETGYQIIVPHPRDDSGGVSYFIDEPFKVADYPCIMIIPQIDNFTGTRTGVAKYGFQEKDVTIQIKIFYKTDRSEKLDILSRGLMRLTDCVVMVLRRYWDLRDDTDDSDPIGKSVDIGIINYAPSIYKNSIFLKASYFDVKYKVLDSLTQRINYD